MWTLSAIFKMATAGVSILLISYKYFVLLQVAFKIYIIIRDTYHIFSQPFCKMAATKVIKMLCVGLMCVKILYLLSVPLKMYI